MQKELFEQHRMLVETVEGAVKNVTDFGAFIDLGGADGLLHISEMSWGRVENPKKVFKYRRSSKSSDQRYQRREDRSELKVPGEQSVGKRS